MADESKVPQDNVDETPISPTNSNAPARRNSIEHHLLHRPAREELVQKNILPDSTAAPSLQAQQKDLAKHMRADSLSDKISHRPSPETLLEKGVLHEDPRSLDEESLPSGEKA
ncbi:hypothetical protein SODALDRAFT_323249 [Sodiomyces alkalinus F11]|uniref:RPEL repeat protein n=1 Tax=Sodiomyces alkalinus (strain CBS 110278 / VKM F-3762 / F11) TaxID=1314773 RepID=A0A3N2PZU6_SODAK|nr:hypothetical protein SODALDRAFT_323249 [Sodiomyces alkalinus F11]ROT39958.1 hypothetical protein SODALDRAFT_323249 [Sodiomyces alkalinus F11]